MRQRTKLVALMMPMLVAFPPDGAVRPGRRGRRWLVCAVLREDGVVTDVPSGENTGKSLVARFPARQTKYEFIELDGKATATQKLPFVIERTWNQQKLRLAVFVQEKRTGVVHQAADLPRRSTPTPTTSASFTSKTARATR